MPCRALACERQSVKRSENNFLLIIVRRPDARSAHDCEHKTQSDLKSVEMKATTMSDTQTTIQGSVGAGGKNSTIDTYVVQFLLNVARARIDISPIGSDGDVGPETIGAIRDFQIKGFGAADGRVDVDVDVDGRSFRRLVEIYSEPVLASPRNYVRGRHGRYKVLVGVDGRVFARNGDWLSKYSAAINGDYIHVYDFGRMIYGQLHLLRNVNLIRAGEVLYHIPTWRAYMQGKSAVPPPIPPPLDAIQKKRITEDALNGGFNIKWNVGIKIADLVGDILQGSEFVLEIIYYLFPILEGLAEANAIIILPFETYGLVRDFCNASDTDLRMYGMGAAAYSTTAWAFGERIPEGSPEIRRNHQAQPATPEQMRPLDDAWRTAAHAAVSAQKKFAREYLGPTVRPEQKEAAWQATLRAVGDGNKGKLSVELMKKLGEETLIDSIPQTKRVWELGYNTPYPN